MTAHQQIALKKILQVFFLGQLVGLPTLQSILTKYGMSNYRQKSYKSICKALSINKIKGIFESVFEHQVYESLKSLCEKDSSCWSRELVTVVLDDSIFKQWLQSQDPEQAFENCYGRFFSGQYGRVVYGFKVVTLGICVDGIFYPLYFDFVKKSKEGEAAPEKAVKVAEKLVKRWGKWTEKLKKQGLILPKLHFSCDNGYSDVSLANTCEQNHLIYISVAKKSHYFEIENQKIKLSDWINQSFIAAEKVHEEKQKTLPDGQKKPFIYRVRANYCSKKLEVTLLAFRLNGSEKVSVIYTPDKTIFAKTLRRHWFQRTYIEQFFKLLKHTLKIQEARTTNKTDFEIKLLRFAFIAWHAQQLVRFVRKKLKGFGKKGFLTIQRLLNSDPDFLDLLQKTCS